MAKRRKRKQRENNRTSQDRWIVLAVVVVVLIIIVYAISLGKINLIEQEDEKTRRIRWIDKRLKSLCYQAQTKEELKRKLDKKVRQYFLYTRIALAVFYIAANVCGLIWLTDGNAALGDRLSVLLNYNEVVLIVTLIVLFIRFETPSEFRDVFRLIHLSIARIVYRNHKELDGDIKEINKEVVALTKEKDGLVKLTERSNGEQKDHQNRIENP